MKKLAGMNLDRRELVGKGGILIASVAVLQRGTPFAWAVSPDQEEKVGIKKEEEEILPVEDLMREHGALDRILLIFDEVSRRLEKGIKFPIETLREAVGLIRRFVEDYHEKLEEDSLFPRFENAGRLVDLVKTLLEQHRAGRRLTDRILHLASLPALHGTEKRQMIHSLRLFARMYRPHKSREDTVLFPVFHSLVSPPEYHSLGEQFEDRETELFGENGFEKVVKKVAGLEKSLGIYSLAQFTPKF